MAATVKFVYFLAVLQHTISNYSRLSSIVNPASSGVLEAPVTDSLLSCAGRCNIIHMCISFTYNRHDGQCLLFSTVSLPGQGRIKAFEMVSFITVNAVCKLPSIPKGRLLSVDGLQEGSKAWFICDDFHFTNISHGVCRAGEGWERLDSPCVHESGKIHVILARGRLGRGMCFNIVARKQTKKGSVSFLAKDMITKIFNLSLRPRSNRMNSFIDDKWGTFQPIHKFTANGKGDIDLAICTEDDVYRLYLNGSETSIYKHRAPVTEIHYIRSKKIDVRSMRFTDQGEIRQHAPCRVLPTIPKGSLLAVEGLQEGSKAWFMCNDYHFTNISHGVCGAAGLWEGLNSPCVHMDASPYLLLSNGRNVEGKCMATIARWAGKTRGSISFLSKDKSTHIFDIHVSRNDNQAVMNSFINGHWGQEETSKFFWPDYNLEANLTICTEDNVYRVYINETEKLIYKHRQVLSDVFYILVDGFTVRSIMFTDSEDFKVQPPCKELSSIPNGKVLSIDGVRKGSKIRFTCNDFHFSNMEHSVCGADGRWQGLDDLCFYKSGPPYLLLSSGRLSPGKCMTLLAEWLVDKKGSIGFSTKSMKNTIFRIGFNKKKVSSNSYLNGHWNKEQMISQFWFPRNAEANLTICIDEEMFTFYFNGNKLLEYTHRFPVAKLYYISSHGLAIRNMMFTDEYKA